MPDDWQGRMAAFLEEYDQAFPNQPEIGTRVLCTRSRKLVRWPARLLNYRYPDCDEIAKLKPADCLTPLSDT